jgi:hypothetical protein
MNGMSHLFNASSCDQSIFTLYVFWGMKMQKRQQAEFKIWIKLYPTSLIASFTPTPNSSAFCS